jgi:hypothetical protein
MNFVKYQHTIKELLHSKGEKPYSGLYVYSRKAESNTYKIGLSEASLYNRLKNHKTCYGHSDEYILEYLIVIKNGQRKEVSGNTHTRQLEKALLHTTRHLDPAKFEARNTAEQGQRPREYRVLTKPLLRQILKATLNLMRVWDSVIVFAPRGWHIVNNTLKTRGGLRQLTLNALKPRLKTIGRPQLKSQTIERSDMKFTGVAKAGDVLTSSNWPDFTVLKILGKDKYQGTFRGSKKKYDVSFPS